MNEKHDSIEIDNISDWLDVIDKYMLECIFDASNCDLSGYNCLQSLLKKNDEQKKDIIELRKRLIETQYGRLLDKQLYKVLNNVVCEYI